MAMTHLIHMELKLDLGFILNLSNLNLRKTYGILFIQMFDQVFFKGLQLIKVKLGLLLSKKSYFMNHQK